MLYEGEFYRNRTGNNTNTVPPSDRTKWLALTNDLLIKVASNGSQTLTISDGSTATQWNNAFNLEVIDSHNAFDINTLTFTAPLNGWYEVHSFFRINTAISVGNLYWSLNGNDFYSRPNDAIFLIDSSDTVFRSLSVYGLIYMNVGGTLSLRNRHGGVTSIQISGNSTTIIKRIRD